ncbi:MAG: hydrogenase nickel incorporation protein HypA/HybF [Actinomycetota bacterium]|nr:hydrogenase nickel incorporation protein HypA/HybF [Actinomycetota bacterium]
MHELSISNAIATVALDHAGERDVRSVQVRVGVLRQIVPESLTFCWEVVSRQPRLVGSTLEIEQVPGVVECSDCGARSTLTEYVLRCLACGSGLVKVLSGEEFLVTSIDVASADPPSAGVTSGGTPKDRMPVGTERKEG